MHPTSLPEEIVTRVIARRGKLNVFERIDSSRTALVVIDMQNTFCAPGAAIEVPVAREIAPNINRLADAMRASGGTVAWVQMTIPSMEDWPVFLGGVVAPPVAETVLSSLRPGSDGQKLWDGVRPASTDLFVTKNRFSAFLPTASKLPELLQQRGVDTIVIAGTLTNVCCESSARDAMMLNFKTIMVSDANAARSDQEHLAALITFVQSFGDVRPTDEVIALLRAEAHGVKVSAAAE